MSNNRTWLERQRDRATEVLINLIMAVCVLFVLALVSLPGFFLGLWLG